MNDKQQTEKGLLNELAAARQRIRELEEMEIHRKKTVDALQASVGKYRELIQKANSIILRRDAGGRNTFFNEFAQKFFGYSEERSSAATWSERSYPRRTPMGAT